MSTALGDHIMISAHAAGTIGRDATDCLILRDLVETVRWSGQPLPVRRIRRMLPRGADGASDVLNSPNIHGFLINPKVDLAPNPPFGTTMLAGVRFRTRQWFARKP